MASRVKNRISDKLFVDTCENSQSMAKACAELNLHFNSFKKIHLALLLRIPVMLLNKSRLCCSFPD